MRRRIPVAAIASLLALLPAGARAGTAGTTLNVSVNVIPACTVSTTDLNFGNYAAGGNQINGSASIIINCVQGVAYHIALDAGQNYASGWRHVAFNGNLLTYALLNPATGLEWGDSDYDNTYPSGASVAGTGTGMADTLPVGAALAGTGPEGTYTDVVQVTVHY